MASDPKFSEIDAAIVRAIDNGADTFTPILGRVRTLAEPLATARYGYKDTTRVVDRRLQALRRSGRIIYTMGRWYVPREENNDGK